MIQRITVYLPPVTKKNSQRILRAGNRLFIAPSAKYAEYERDVLNALTAAGVKPWSGALPVNVKAIFYMPSRRAVDLTNLLEAIDDILVRGHILPDDSWQYIAGHDGSRVRYDKIHPRTEIEISEEVGL